MLPLVTVRVPAYNHANYIIDCLNSVRDDSYSNKELVIIDDGSSDETPDLIESWIRDNDLSFPVFFKRRENRGITRTINELVSLSQGDFLVSLASDDMLISGGIIARLQFLIDNPEYLAVFGDAELIDKQGKTLSDSTLFNFRGRRKENYRSGEKLLDEILFRWSVPGPVLMVRKETYDQVGAYNEHLRFEDWDFYTRLACKGKLAFIDHCVAKYRIHDKNFSQSAQGARINSVERLNAALRNFKLIPPRKKIKFAFYILRLLYHQLCNIIRYFPYRQS